MKVSIPVRSRRIVEQCPNTWEDIEDIRRVPCASAVGSLIYEMVCTGPEISHVVGVLSRYISTPGKDHWT
jgi:hypothetical protein